jgi:cytoskeletal protein RodZ
MMRVSRSTERCAEMAPTMTDHPDANGSGHRRRPRSPKLGDSRAPVTNVAVLVAAGIAVIAGILILRSVTNPAESEEPGNEVGTTANATLAPTTVTSAPASTTEPPTTTSSTTTTSVPRASKSDATIVVANASGVDRSATAMSEDLAADGYTTAPVANTTGPRLDQSVIYYQAGNVASLGVAHLLADQIPTARISPMPDPPPLDRPLGEATVALMLGLDAAGRPLSELTD